MLKKSVCSASRNILANICRSRSKLLPFRRLFSVQLVSPRALTTGLKELEEILKVNGPLPIKDLPNMSCIHDIIERYEHLSLNIESIDSLVEYQLRIRATLEQYLRKFHKAMGVPTFVQILEFANTHNFCLSNSSLKLIMNEVLEISHSYSMDSISEVLFLVSRQSAYKEDTEHGKGIQKIYTRANDSFYSIEGSIFANLLCYAEASRIKSGPVSGFISRARLLLLSRSNYYLFELFKQRILPKIQYGDQGQKLSLKEIFKKYIFSLVFEGNKNIAYPETIHFCREDLTKMMEIYGDGKDKEIITILIDIFSQIEMQIVAKVENVEGQEKEELEETDQYMRCLKSLSSYESETSGKLL